MEDQTLRTPYDSINATKDLWSKELSEIRSLLKELVGEVATVRPQNRIPMKENREPSPAPPMFCHTYASIKFGRFCGDNPEVWISQAEHYFEFYKIAEKHKLSLASLYLDGEALEWYRWLFRNKQLADWKHFTEKVMIRFRKQHLESQRCQLPNSQQVTSMIDYQSRFEDVSSGYGDFDLASATAYAYPEWSNITNSLVLQCGDEQSEGNNKTNAPKVLDDLSERSKNTNSIDISCELIQLEVEDPHKVCKLTIGDTTEAYFPNDLAYSIYPTDEATGCDNHAKSENKNDEEEIVTISDEPIEFIIANASKPSLWINSIASISYCVAMFDIHKVLNDRPNQFFAGQSEDVYPQHGLRLAPCWKRFSISSTCSYDKFITRGITSRLGHDAILLILNLFPPGQFELEFPFDPGSSLLTMYNWVFCAALSDLDHDKFIISTLRQSCNWVDTGQRRNFYDFLLSKSRENVMEEKIQGVLHEFAESYSKQSPNTPVNRIVKLLCTMFGLVHKSRFVSRYIHFSPGQFLDCGTFRFDRVLNHFLISLCVQSVQTQHPRPPPKPPSPALLLEFLAQVAQSIESPMKLNLCGLVIVDGDDSNTSAHLLTAHFSTNTNATVSLVAMLEDWKVIELRIAYRVIFQVVHPIVCTLYGLIEMVELVVCHRFHQVLAALERNGGERASKIVHQYSMGDNFRFERSDHVKEYCLYQLPSASGTSFYPSSTLDDILDIPSFDSKIYILAYCVSMPIGRGGIDTNKEWRDHLDYIHELLIVNIRRDPHADAVIKVQKLSKNGVNSGILKAAYRIMILFLMVFTCSNQGIYNTPSCRIKFYDTNLEDKVLIEGGSIVVTRMAQGKRSIVVTSAKESEQLFRKKVWAKGKWKREGDHQYMDFIMVQIVNNNCVERGMENEE